MARQKITMIDDSPALLLSPELLEAIGISVGDEVEINVEDRALIIRGLNENERQVKLDEMMKELMNRRRSTYERLAEGAK